jgi:hypothetical protein
MTNHNLCCLTHHTAELYAMNQLKSTRAEVVEEHLLICSPCIDRVVEAGAYIGVFRAAAVSIQ